VTALPSSGPPETSEPVPDKGLGRAPALAVADVRRGESLSALLLMATMFLLLGGYYLLKTAREGFILSEGGAEVKSYSSAGQALVLLVLVPAYSALASRVNRIQLIQWVTLFFASNLVLFLLALGAGFRIGIVYFLWVGIFNVMVIAQFWASPPTSTARRKASGCSRCSASAPASARGSARCARGSW
jgi:AAA family ATP:ADP antiporter